MKNYILKKSKKAQGARVFMGILFLVIMLIVLPTLVLMMNYFLGPLLVNDDSTLFLKVLIILFPFIIVMVLFYFVWRSFRNE